MPPSESLRLRCYYCDDTLQIPWREVGDRERAHAWLRSHGWVFGVMPLDDKGGVIERADLKSTLAFDPICTECAKSMVKDQIAQSPSVTIEAAQALKGLGLLGQKTENSTPQDDDADPQG